METKTRINPDTGVHEIEGALGWKPLLNDDGEQVRTNLSVHLFWRTRNRLKSQPTQGSNGWQYARRQT